MLIKKIMVGILATLFVLASASATIAGDPERTPNAGQFTFPDQTSSSLDMDTGHDMNSATEEAPPQHNKQMEKQNLRPVVCAASVRDTLPRNQEEYCREIYGG